MYIVYVYVYKKKTTLQSVKIICEYLPGFPVAISGLWAGFRVSSSGFWLSTRRGLLGYLGIRSSFISPVLFNCNLNKDKNVLQLKCLKYVNGL